MGLSAGTRLGPYEIQAPLGAGGMGEVYRARDTKLGRDAAIKIWLGRGYGIHEIGPVMTMKVWEMTMEYVLKYGKRG